MSPSALRALLVDYGGVLTTALSDCMGAWCEADGVDPADFAALMHEWLATGSRPAGGSPGVVPGNPVHALEVGALSITAFERELADRLRTRGGGRLAADGLLSRMFAGFAPEETMVAVLRTAKAAGLRTGLVSNSWGMDYPRSQWDQLFDAVVISGEVGLRKPDPRIYRLAAEKLGVRPEECVFVDDLSPNVRGAVAVGMIGVRHVDAATTRDELAVLFGLPL